MKALGERSIASLIRFILDATWWLIIIAMAVFVGLLVFRSTFQLEGNNLTMDLPVALELNASVRDDGSSLSNARIENVRGNLRFPARNRAFFARSIALMLLFMGLLLWTLAQLRHIFRSLSRGVPFIPENGRRIRWVGFAVIFGEVARAALIYSWSSYTSVHFTAEGLRFIPRTDFSGMTILCGLAILVIAEVFREGARLHEDQSMTI